MSYDLKEIAILIESWIFGNFCQKFKTRFLDENSFISGLRTLINNLELFVRILGQEKDEISCSEIYHNDLMFQASKKKKNTFKQIFVRLWVRVRVVCVLRIIITAGWLTGRWSNNGQRKWTVSKRTWRLFYDTRKNSFLSRTKMADNWPKTPWKNLGQCPLGNLVYAICWYRL